MKSIMQIRICCFIAALSTVVASTGLFAQEAEEPTASDSTRLLQRAINERDETIQHLLTRIEQLEKRVGKIEVGRDRESQASSNTGEIRPKFLDRPIVREGVDDETKGSVTSAAAPIRLEPDQREKERLIRAAFEQTLIDRGGLLLPPGTFDLEPSIAYVHSSSDNIVIDGFALLPVLIVGDIVSQRIRRDQTVAAMTARLGLPRDSQIEIRVPFVHQTRKTFSADNKEEIVSDSGLGDVEIALSHQLYKSRGEWPDLLTSLRWKSTTGDSPFKADKTDLVLGTGFNSFGLSFTAVKVVDPVVYFGGVNYIYNSSVNEDIGHLKPGDGIGFNLGMAIALNLNSSLNFAYDQQFIGRSKLNGALVPGSYLTAGVFSVGSSYSLTNNRTVDVSIGIGVTSDSPDVLFRMSFPFRGKL